MRAWVIKTTDGYWSYWLDHNQDKASLNEATLFKTQQDAADVFMDTEETAVPVEITLVKKGVGK